MNNDLISREALKKALEKYRYKTTLKSLFLDGLNCMFMNCISEIDNAPTVEERPQGEWIYDDLFNNWKCSECGETPKTIGYVGNADFMKEHFKFCNHCGADMRKGGAE